MTKKYLKAKVVGFVDNENGQMILCNVHDHVLAVKNGGNGIGTICPIGLGMNGRIIYGGFAAIEIVETADGMFLKPSDGDAQELDIPVSGDNSDIIDETTARRMFLLERPHTLISRSLADSMGFMSPDLKDEISMNSSGKILKKAIVALEDADTESGAVDALDLWVSGILENFREKKPFPKP